MPSKLVSARAAGLTVLVASVLAAAGVLGPERWRDTAIQWLLDRPFTAGFLAIATQWLLILSVTGSHPWKLVEGEDGRASSSKAQLLLRTVAAIFAYVVITVARIKVAVSGAALFEPIETFPPGLLLAVGFSSTTAVAAKGITSSYVRSKGVASAHRLTAALLLSMVPQFRLRYGPTPR